MDWTQLLQAALTLVVSFGVRWFFTQINVIISDEVFLAIVGGIVTYLLGIFVHNAVAQAVSKTRLANSIKTVK